MAVWNQYPLNYRAREVGAILDAVQAGECVSVIGLSGSGKSNLLGFLAHRYQELTAQSASPSTLPVFYLLDSNYLSERSPAALIRFIHSSLGDSKLPDQTRYEPAILEAALEKKLLEFPGICLLFDRFDQLTVETPEPERSAIFGVLRAFRDRYKYALTFVTATRQPLDPHTELAELFFANTIWLGPLQESDAQWSILQFAQRHRLTWDESVINKIYLLSGGYPSLLRAVCEAVATGLELTEASLASHPAVMRRVAEFWADQPSEQALRESGLNKISLLKLAHKTFHIDTTELTAKEHLLWEYFTSHPKQICTKDELIRAVWPEDRVYESGIRDDSLAQLARRLREKIESDPSNPRFIQTIPGRGYRYLPDQEK